MSNPWNLTPPQGAQLDANGFAKINPINDYGPNPYEAIGAANSAQATMNTQSSQNQMQGYQNQMKNFNEGSGYPAFPNNYGLGSPINQEKATPDPIASASGRGFNPWSLTGESNAR